MSPTVDPAEFRRFMGRWATGVSVVTAHEAGKDFGLTVNAFLSVSLDPPTVLVSLGEEANTTPVVSRRRRFAVSLLRADQEPLSHRFARADVAPSKFEGVPIHRWEDGTAVLDGTLGALLCRVREEYRAGDHRLFLADVEAMETGSEGLPLLFYRGKYGRAQGPTTVDLPPATG